MEEVGASLRFLLYWTPSFQGTEPRPTLCQPWATRDDLCSVALTLSFCVFGNKRKKDVQKRLLGDLKKLFNAWLFAYIWPRPVGHNLPSILNGSQGTPSVGSTAMTFLYHFNCSNKMPHDAQPSSDKPVICQSGCKNQTRNTEIFPAQRRMSFQWSFCF